MTRTFEGAFLARGTDPQLCLLAGSVCRQRTAIDHKPMIHRLSPIAGSEFER